MKKFLNHATTLVVATLLLNACIADNPFNPDPIEYGEGTSVLLQLTEAETEFQTRVVGNVDETRLALVTGDIYLVAPNGTIVEHFRIVQNGGTAPVGTYREIPATAHSINRSDLHGGVRITNVPTSMRNGRVYVVGNSRVSLPTTGNISAVLDQELDIRHQRGTLAANSQGAHLFGKTELVRITAAGVTPEVWAPPFYVCGCQMGVPFMWRCYHINDFLTDRNTTRRFLTLSPAVARIAIPGIIGMGEIGTFTVEGVFVDNYYRRATIGGTRSMLRTNITDGLYFGYNSSGYPWAFRNHTFSWHGAPHGTGIESHLASVELHPGPIYLGAWQQARPGGFASGQGWIFYLFAGVKTEVPHLVFRLRNVTVAGVVREGPYYVTFRNDRFVWHDMADNHPNQPGHGTPVTGIGAGHNYHISMNHGMIFTELELTPAPTLATTLSTRVVPIMIE